VGGRRWHAHFGCRCRSLFKLFTYPVLIAYVRDARTYIPYHGHYHMDALMRYRRSLPRTHIFNAVSCTIYLPPSHTCITSTTCTHFDTPPLLRPFWCMSIQRAIILRTCARTCIWRLWHDWRLVRAPSASCIVLFQTQADITCVWD
jgi:hypothetical protein